MKVSSLTQQKLKMCEVTRNSYKKLFKLIDQWGEFGESIMLDFDICAVSMVIVEDAICICTKLVGS